MPEIDSLSTVRSDLPAPRGAEYGRRHNRLARFVLLAAALHLVALGLWRLDPPVPPAGAGPVTVALEIVQGAGPGSQTPVRPAPVTRLNSTAPEAPASESEANSPAKQPGPNQSPRAPAPRPTGRTVKAPPPAPSSQRPQARQADAAPGRDSANSPAFLRPFLPSSREAPGRAPHLQQPERAAGDPDPLDAEQTRARLGHRLRASIARHFRYPALARRRGWEGRVQVGLRVEPDGELSRVHLVSTSGHTLLDHDAVATIRHIAGLPNVVSWLGGRHFDMVLPVHYRLVSD